MESGVFDNDAETSSPLTVRDCSLLTALDGSGSAEKSLLEMDLCALEEDDIVEAVSALLGTSNNTDG
jgi:hypothetical protein